MRPANISQAQRHMQHLLEGKISGRRKTRVREHSVRAKTIAETIYRQYQVGPYQYRLHHLQWYLRSPIKPLKPASQYPHWLTISMILKALGCFDQWESLLEGRWRRAN